MEADPSDNASANRAAACHAAEGRFEKALEIYDLVLARDPESVVARTGSREARRWLDVRAEAAALAEEKGLAGLRDAINRAKDDGANPRFRLEGRRLLLEREGSASDWCGFGRELGKASEHDQALSAYRTALTLDGSDEMRSVAFVGAAAVLRRMGRFQKAGELLRWVLTVDPSNEYASTALEWLLSDAASDSPPDWLIELRSFASRIDHDRWPKR